MSLLVVVVVVVVWRRRALGVVDIFVLVWGVLGSPVRCCKYRASGYQDVEGGCKLLKWVIGVEEARRDALVPFGNIEYQCLKEQALNTTTCIKCYSVKLQCDCPC